MAVQGRWIAAAVAVAALSLGLSGIFKFVLSVAAFVGGVLVVVCAAASSKNGQQRWDALLTSSQKWARTK